MRPPEWKRKKLAYVKHLRRHATAAETMLWRALKDKNRHDGAWPNFISQRKGLGYILDFYAGKRSICVEVDGSSHEGKEAWDAERTKALEAYGVRVLRFTNERVLSDLGGVMLEIWQAMLGRAESSLPRWRSQAGTPDWRQIRARRRAGL
jgi:very-short-patch-repair endonuclease